jgi:hypothetical protein
LSDKVTSFALLQPTFPKSLSIPYSQFFLVYKKRNMQKVCLFPRKLALSLATGFSDVTTTLAGHLKELIQKRKQYEFIFYITANNNLPESFKGNVRRPVWNNTDFFKIPSMTFAETRSTFSRI